jgi:hypothetical protein
MNIPDPLFAGFAVFAIVELLLIALHLIVAAMVK